MNHATEDEERWWAKPWPREFDGPVLAYAKSMDPHSPFVGVAWWDGKKLTLMPQVWCEAATHIMPMPKGPASLGWDDPHPTPERECQVAGCHQHATSGSPTPDGYKRLCGDHYAALAQTKPCACGREGSLDHEDFCMPKSMWPRHWVTGEPIDPDAALAPDDSGGADSHQVPGGLA